MTELESLPDIDSRSAWLRMRTVIALRWLAIAGQSAAVAVAALWFGFDLPIGACFLAISALALANIAAMLVYPANRRLTEREAIFLLAFDLAQLTLLLALTGGLNNPFALLVLAPVTIAATVLRLRDTVLVGCVALIAVSAMALWHLPLVGPDGTELRLPPLFALGFWVAILVGVVFLAGYTRQVTQETHAMQQALAATQLALGREQRLTALGGVVAAAAHELGTPLATIKLTAAELVEELRDRDDLRADAELIRSQADRCRDIMRSMGSAGKDDMLLRHAPLEALLREAAEPHAGRGKAIHYTIGPDPTLPGEQAPDQPLVLRRPEILHGLRNLVQNAVDFAEANVWIDLGWSQRDIYLRVSDDGPGYPPELIVRIGEPFLRRRWRDGPAERPDYEGMGLGLFIAKTLLERSGAELAFANGAPPSPGSPRRGARCGAVVEVWWPWERLALPADRTRSALEANPQIRA